MASGQAQGGKMKETIIVKKGYSATGSRTVLREGYAAPQSPQNQSAPPPPTTERAISALRRPPAPRTDES